MARQPWRPRHGKKLNEKPGRSFLEIQSAFIARFIPKFLLHPLWALVVAALIAGTGRRELFLRSCGFLFVALWLSLDLWVWLLGKKVEADYAWFWQSSKFAIGWTVTSCLLLMVMETMLWGLESERREALKSVWNTLRVEHSATEDGDPMFERFTAINDSEFEISKRHRLICMVNVAVSAKGHFGIRGLGSIEGDDGRLAMSPDPSKLHMPSDSPVHAGGDVQTNKCLSFFNFGFEKSFGTGCADVSIVFWYSLEDWPDAEQSKVFRFAAVRDDAGHYEWSRQNDQAPHTICKEYIQKQERLEKANPPPNQ